MVVLLDFQEIDSTAKLDAKTLFDLVKLSFGVVAGAGALVALVVAYRRQRVDEAGAHREATRLHTERFSQAVDKLGSDSPAVRLGGVHALAGLADDAPDDSLRQTCIDVLCAYLQLPFTPDPGDDPAHQEEHHRYLAFRKVRHTILRLISDHYRRPRGTPRSWQGCDLDLTGVIIDGSMDFDGATFSDGVVVTFDGATFSDGVVVTFRRATFSDAGWVSFRGATFSGSDVLPRQGALPPRDVLRQQGVLRWRDVLRRHASLPRRNALRRHGVLPRRNGSGPQWASHCRRHSCFCVGHRSLGLADLESVTPRRRKRLSPTPGFRRSLLA
ncbi:pentapeptide repeat-containing protein [Streptomyces sp. NPDC046900]|uniref:pentapeptide repeat-containing protein n=1 Tax=Streptomyces sp. NPDC046900 TaxID=3155473 RepID=UPI0033FA5CF9